MEARHCVLSLGAVCRTYKPWAEGNILPHIGGTVTGGWLAGWPAGKKFEEELLPASRRPAGWKKIDKEFTQILAGRLDWPCQPIWIWRLDQIRNTISRFFSLLWEIFLCTVYIIYGSEEATGGVPAPGRADAAAPVGPCHPAPRQGAQLVEEGRRGGYCGRVPAGDHGEG